MGAAEQKVTKEILGKTVVDAIQRDPKKEEDPKPTEPVKEKDAETKEIVKAIKAEKDDSEITAAEDAKVEKAETTPAPGEVAAKKDLEDIVKEEEEIKNFPSVTECAPYHA